MSRWKSPQIVAKRAERAAKEAGQARKDKLNAIFWIIGVALVSSGLVIADYFRIKARAQRRQEEHQKIYHRARETNSPTSTNLNATTTNLSPNS